MSKHKDQVCRGVQIHVEDRNTFEPFRTALSLLDEIRALHEDQIVWRDCTAGHDLPPTPGMTFERYADKLIGDKRYTTGELNGEALLAAHEDALQAYIARKKKYELYE